MLEFFYDVIKLKGCATECNISLLDNLCFVEGIY